MSKVTKDEVERLYLIRKHGAYYRPNNRGYTTSAICAGRYSLEEARRETHPNGLRGPRDGMTYLHEDSLKDEDWIAYATLRQQLAEEREKVARVECYWDADDREIGHLDICEILENCGPGEVAEIEHVAVVATTFEAFLPAADDAETDDQFEVCEDTREAAEAKVAQELARRAALSTTEAKTDDQ